MIILEEYKLRWGWPLIRKEFTVVEFRSDGDVFVGPFLTEESARAALRLMLC